MNRLPHELKTVLSMMTLVCIDHVVPYNTHRECTHELYFLAINCDLISQN